jgi:hypothetical protein
MYHKSRRCSRDTYPQSFITKYTSIRKLLDLAGWMRLHQSPLVVLRVPDSGFRVSCFMSRVSCFRFQDPGFGFRVSGSGFRVSGSSFRFSGFGFRVPGFVFLVSGSGFRVSGFGFLVSSSGFLVSGFWFLVPEFSGRQARGRVAEGGAHLSQTMYQLNGLSTVN